MPYHFKAGFPILNAHQEVPMSMIPEVDSTRIGRRSNKRLRSASSLAEQLERQIKYLKNSARLFDEGDEDEAIRLATTLRVLLHDSTNKESAPSLLRQCGIKDTLLFEDTGIYRDRYDTVTNEWAKRHSGDENTMILGISPVDMGLVITGLNHEGQPAWVAPLRPRVFPLHHPASGAEMPPQPFDKWWKTPLIEGSDFRAFSRENLVCIMTNQDGGAHVDPGLDIDYENLCKDSLGSSWLTGDGSVSSNPDDFIPVTGNVAASSVRQITFEVLLTLDRHLNPGSISTPFGDRDNFYMPSPLIMGKPYTGENDKSSQ